MDTVALFIPLAGMAMTFGIVYVVFWYLMQRSRAQARLGDEARDIVQRAVDGQRLVLAETEALKAKLADVERLLREV
jgi:hypothetical protein